MLVGGVVGDEIRDDRGAPPVRLGKEGLEVGHAAVEGRHGGEVRDVVSVVPQGGGKEGEEPDATDAEVRDVVEAVDQPPEVAGPVVVRVLESLDVDLVEDG